MSSTLLDSSEEEVKEPASSLATSIAPAAVKQKPYDPTDVDDWRNQPLFAPTLDPRNPLAQGILELQKEEDPVDRATELKASGKKAFQLERFADALTYFTQALAVNCADKKLNAILNSNVAIVHLKKRNFRKALDACQAAIALDGTLVKVQYLAAKACVQLSQLPIDLTKSIGYLTDASEYCQRAIDIVTTTSKQTTDDCEDGDSATERLPSDERVEDCERSADAIRDAKREAESETTEEKSSKLGDSTESKMADVSVSELKTTKKATVLSKADKKMIATVQRLQKQVKGKLNDVLRRQMEKYSEAKMEEKRAEVLAKAIAKKGYSFGDDAFHTRGAYGDVAAVALADDWAMYESMDSMKETLALESVCLSFAVLFIYPQYSASDLVKDFADSDTFAAHLSLMFPPTAPSPKWDVEMEYDSRKLNVYFRNSDGCIVEVHCDSTLSKVLSRVDCVIPRMPVFFVLPKKSAFVDQFFSEFGDS